MSKNKKDEIKKENLENNIFSIRIITLGNTTVGKSTLISRYVDNCFSENYLMTVGMDKKIKKVKLKNGKEINVILIDTVGQEKFRSLASNYIKKTDGILLVYDITEEQTFKGVKQWIEHLKEESEDFKPTILIGNKLDLDEMRSIETEDGKKLADSCFGGIKFYETSCKTGENVVEAIDDLVEQVYKKIKETNPDEVSNFSLKYDNNKKNEKNKKKCC